MVASFCDAVSSFNNNDFHFLYNNDSKHNKANKSLKVSSSEGWLRNSVEIRRPRDYRLLLQKLFFYLDFIRWLVKIFLLENLHKSGLHLPDSELVFEGNNNSFGSFYALPYFYKRIVLVNHKPNFCHVYKHCNYYSFASGSDRNHCPRHLYSFSDS